MIAMLAAMTAAMLAPVRTAERTSGDVAVAPGVTVHYERIGYGPQTVIVPGRFLFNGALDRLASPGRTVILYDMRNRGASSAITDDSQISLQADVDDIEALRKHFGAPRISLIGYSYMGMMTALYAAQHPDRVERLAQLGPVPMKYDAPQPPDLVWKDSAPLISEADTARIERLRAEGFDRAQPQEFCLRYESVMRVRVVGNPANARKIDYARRCAMPNEWPVNFQRHLRIHFQGSVQKFEPPRDRFRALAIPVLTIHGTRDRNAPFAGGVEWATTFPAGRFIVAHGAAHNLWLDDDRAVADVDAFLSGKWPARAVKLASYDDARRLLPKGLD